MCVINLFEISSIDFFKNQKIGKAKQIYTHKNIKKEAVWWFCIFFGEYIRIYIYKYQYHQYLARNDSEARFCEQLCFFCEQNERGREIDVVCMI
jgi:hypothetical protein